MLKDFNIANEAKGVDREVVIPIKNVSVVNKTLTIRFHWAGKGTMATPFRGAYGPLVSAISVKCGELFNFIFNLFFKLVKSANSYQYSGPRFEPNPIKGKTNAVTK